MFIFSTIGLIVLVLFGAILATNGCALVMIFQDWPTKIAGIIITALGVAAIYFACKLSPFQMILQMVR